MARRRLRTTRTQPRTRRDGGGERPRDDHRGVRSRPTGYDRDEPVAPRIEVTLVEPAGDAGARFAKRALAAVPRTHARWRRAVRLDLILMLADRVPYLALDRAILEPALASEAVGCGRGRVLLRRDVEALDDQKAITCEEAARFRDRLRARVVVEYSGEGIVRRDDEVVFALRGEHFESRGDVENSARIQTV